MIFKGGRNAKRRPQPGAGLEQAAASRSCRCKWQECRSGSPWDRRHRPHLLQVAAGVQHDSAAQLTRIPAAGARNHQLEAGRRTDVTSGTGSGGRSRSFRRQHKPAVSAQRSTADTSG